MDTYMGLGTALVGGIIFLTIIVVCHTMNNPIDQSKKLLLLFVSLVLYVPTVGYVYYGLAVYVIVLGITNLESSVSLGMIGSGIFYLVLFSIVPILALREIRKTLREGEEEINPPQKKKKKSESTS
ncbi:MAG: hypothetical protein RTU30_06105 [Candidatus Thorarchaeota archaeon]